MADPIDDVWSAPSSDVSPKKLSQKELLRQYELLQKQVLQQDLESDALKKQVGDLQKKLVAANELVASLGESQDRCLLANEDLRKEVAALKAENAAGGVDRVIYKGKVHKIVRVNTAKWFALDDFRKRFVEEDDTVIVIDRKGT